VSNYNCKDKDNTVLGEVNNRDGGNNNAKFAFSNGRNYNKNYYKCDRAIFKTTILILRIRRLRIDDVSKNFLVLSSVSSFFR